VIPCALYLVRFRPGSVHTGMPVDRFLEVAAAKDQVVARRFPRDGGVRRTADDRTLDALYEREATRLWSGRRPVLLGQIVSRGLVQRSRRRARLVAWAAWGRLSPSSLRLAARLWIRGRDHAAGRLLRDGHAVEWRFG
jgi:hypothetical protein